MAEIGYARVSTEEQNLDLQIQALQQAGCKIICNDSGVSGATQSRPGLDKALDSLNKGDKLIVWRLDRLGRSLSHLIEIINFLEKKNIGFQSLCEYIDTSSVGGRLIFHIMASFAEFERGLISERTRAGMAAARAEGKHLGRPRSLTLSQSLEARQLIEQGETIKQVALIYGVTPRTLSRTIKKVITL